MRSRCLRIWNKVLQRKKRNGAAWCRNISSHKRLVFYTMRELGNSVFNKELEPNERFTLRKYPKENVLEDVNWSGDCIYNWRDERRKLLLAGLGLAANFIKEMER